MNFLEDENINVRKKGIVFLFVILTIFFSMIYLVLKRYDYPDGMYKTRLFTIVLAIISFLLTCLFAYNTYFKTMRSWYFGILIGTAYFTIFASDIFNTVNYKIVSNILFVILVLAFVIIFLWISKTNFGKVFHTINIIGLSTYSLFILSIVFSSYYYEIYNVAMDIDRSNFFSIFFSTCKVSLRYFFEVPPDEYLDGVTIIQFIIGRIYEAVLIGGIASLVAKTVSNTKKD